MGHGDDGDGERSENVAITWQTFQIPAGFETPPRPRPPSFLISNRYHLETHCEVDRHPMSGMAPQGLVSSVLHRIHALLTTLLLYLLSLGPMPRHVGFVMDGNRRYARTKGMRVSQGHTDGFQSLRRVSIIIDGCANLQTLEVCLKLKIRAVSIYAFAIDNFSRDEAEVDALMGLARTRLMELCQHG